MNIIEIQQRVETVRQARKAQAKNNKLNQVTKQENRKINAHNQRRKYLQGLNEKIIESGEDKPLHIVPRGKKQLELPHRLTPEQTKVLRKEGDTTTFLKKRDPLDWAMRIKQLPVQLRDRLACYVFWDYVADTGHPVFADHIRRELRNKSYKHIEKDTIIEALVSLGYTPYAAMQRVGGAR